MTKTHARLADSREISYFDESDSAVRLLSDPREMDPFRFRPSVCYDVAVSVQEQSPQADPLLRLQPSARRCEVVCLTEDHDSSFSALMPDRVRIVNGVSPESAARLLREIR
jgi:hypothetical protein